MEAKRTEVLNLIHVGLLCWGPTREEIRISGVSKSTVIKVTNSAQMLTPTTKKLGSSQNDLIFTI